MRYLLFITVLFSGISLADQEGISKDIHTEKNRLAEIEGNLIRSRMGLDSKKSQRDKLTDIEGKREQVKSVLLLEIEKSKNRINFVERMFSRKAKFYNCLENFLKKDGYIFVSECRRLTAVKLEVEEEVELKRWYETLGHSGQEINERIKGLEGEIRQTDAEIKKTELQLASGNAKIKGLEEELKRTQGPTESQACSNSIPTIHLGDKDLSLYEGVAHVNNLTNVIHGIKTSGKTVAEQIDMMRERVVIGLIKGLPLAGTFKKTGSSETGMILGLRFNSQKGHCEYLMRDSGKSKTDWKAEKEIFLKIGTLTEMRKK